MNTSITSQDANFIKALKEKLNQQMLQEAEPLVQAALVSIETAMRARLATALIARIDTSLSYQTLQHELIVTIRRGE